jgi:hypothetical protein
VSSDIRPFERVYFVELVEKDSGDAFIQSRV